MRPRAWIRRIRRGLRTARMAFRGRAVILLYHRVASPQADPFLLCVSPEHFGQQLDVIRNEYHPIGLEELAAACAEGHVPDRAVAVTFDDGYADNWQAAAPALARRGIRATVFVAGDCLEGKPFFYDELERFLLWTPQLPRILHLTVEGREYQWDLESWSARPKKPGAEYWKWNIEQTADPTPRHRCYRELFSLLRGASAQSRRRVLSALRKAAGAGAAPVRLWMTKAEMRAAAKNGTLAFGSHTRTHPALNSLSREDQLEEILTGKRMLEKAIGGPTRMFAYPYGSPWDVTEESVRLVREAGFLAACANTPAPVDAESDPFWLPRCIVRNWDGGEFARRMRDFFRPRAEIPPQG
jgi:peptidoglycan/xylan/chitin deacetylase (PgdA/CDA1 family)